jgi:hypothetical protein
LLHEKPEIEKLESAIGDLTGMLISKVVKDLSAQQKSMLQHLFGDSIILHTLHAALGQQQVKNEQLQKFASKVFSLC